MVIVANALRVIAINSVGDFILFLAKAGTVAVVAVVGIEFFRVILICVCMCVATVGLWLSCVCLLIFSPPPPPPDRPTLSPFLSSHCQKGRQ